MDLCAQDSASQMLMKRLRKVVKDPKKSIHSLRHAQADALSGQILKVPNFKRANGG